MSNELVIRESHEIDTQMFSREKLDLLKSTICKDSTDDEFNLFVHACKRSGLDPFIKQIHAVKRWDSNLKRMSMTIQTGIDGYRLIAERTGRYCPGSEPTFKYDEQRNLLSATAYVKKQTKDGTWHEVSACAYFDEYVQKNKDGAPIAMWKNMPRGQLAKCAEALCLRKCFPAELSGVYTKDEMDQSEVIDVNPAKSLSKEPVKVISKEQYVILNDMIGEDKIYRQKVLTHLANMGIKCLEELPEMMYDRVINGATKNFQEKLKVQDEKCEELIIQEEEKEN